MRIRYKLFFVMATISIISILLIAVVSQWNAQQNLIKFQNKLEDNEATMFTQRLIKYYTMHNSWQGFDNNTPYFLNVLKSQAYLQDGKFIPNEKDQYYGIDKRLLLTDEMGNKIIGLGKQTDKRYPIKVNENGQKIIVGWLGIEKHPRYLINPIALSFKQNERTNLFIAIVIISFFSLLFSILFSRQFENRITKLATMSHALTQGKFTKIENIESKNDELGKLAKDLNSLSNTLEKNEHMRRRWIADTSHELRTPIAILRGEIEAIIDKVHLPTDEVIGSIHEEVEHLTKLVDDVHMLSLSESGALKYSMEEIDLGRLLSTIIDSFKTRSNHKDMTFIKKYNWEKEYLIIGDSTRLTQLFNNLFENSLRYTKAPGGIVITIIVKYNFAIISIEDTEPAPKKDEIVHLFNRFYRAETSRNRQTGGSGLGLAICQNIVDSHKGLIDAYQAATGGLGIQISLPLKKEQHYD